MKVAISPSEVARVVNSGLLGHGRGSRPGIHGARLPSALLAAPHLLAALVILFTHARCAVKRQEQLAEKSHWAH